MSTISRVQLAADSLTADVREFYTNRYLVPRERQRRHAMDGRGGRAAVLFVGSYNQSPQGEIGLADPEEHREWQIAMVALFRNVDLDSEYRQAVEDDWRQTAHLPHDTQKA
jgi:hypothetical protein